MENLILFGLAALLLHLAYHDAKNRKIPNIDCFLIILLGIVNIIFLNKTVYDVYLALIVVFGPILAVFVFGSKLIGAGDVKLILALCVSLGFEVVLNTLFWGMLAALLGVVIYRIRGKNINDNIPLGFFIGLSAIFVLFWHY